MSREQRIQRTVEILEQVWETADDLGLVDSFTAWWKSRRAYKRRKARREARRKARQED